MENNYTLSNETPVHSEGPGRSSNTANQNLQDKEIGSLD